MTFSVLATAFFAITATALFYWARRPGNTLRFGGYGSLPRDEEGHPLDRRRRVH